MFSVRDTPWDSTRPVQLGRSSAEVLRERAPLVPDELLEHIDQQNARRVALPDSLGLPVPVELVSEAEIRSVRRSIDQDEWDSQYDALCRRLAGSPGVVSLSRVGFSPERDLALIYLSLRCGSRCGEGSHVLLRKRDGQWQVEHWITMIRSYTLPE